MNIDYSVCNHFIFKILKRKFGKCPAGNLIFIYFSICNELISLKAVEADVNIW